MVATLVVPAAKTDGKTRAGQRMTRPGVPPCLLERRGNRQVAVTTMVISWRHDFFRFPAGWSAEPRSSGSAAGAAGAEAEAGAEAAEAEAGEAESGAAGSC